MLSYVFQLSLLFHSVSLFDSFSSSVTAFSPVPYLNTRSFANRQTSFADSFFVDGTQKQEKTTDIEPVLDAKGNTVTVGAVVRVAVNGLEAYQILPKAKGSFNENKEFVPDTDDDTRPVGRKCLLLPVGMCGVVTKVFNVDEVSANFPIQVKFQPGSYTEEGYDPPAAFLMHFDNNEVELVED